MNKKAEIFKPINKYEDYFMISNYGRLKILKREVLAGKNWKVRRVLKAYIKTNYYCINGINYYYVCLQGKLIVFNVSKEVARAFISNPENKRFVGFKNGNCEDFSSKNLFWK